MEQITELAETIETKQVIDFQQTTETFEILTLRTDNNQFNMTVINTGNIPVHLNRLWIENTTDSSFPISKYDLDIAIPTGGTVTNIGQNLGLTALDSESYMLMLVSDRGNTQKMYSNAVEHSNLYLRLTATPAVLPTTFSSTLTLEVINTGITQLLNLQPEMKLVELNCIACEYTLEQTAFPTSFDSLMPGDTALFEWVYSIEGENDDSVEFTAGLINDLRNDTATITIQTIQSSLNADVAVESGGIGNQVLIDDDILLFHEETAGTPSGEYQMWSGIGDGGGNGDRIQLDNETPHFFTNNGSNSITIPAGTWNVAMMLSSEPVGENVDTNYDMIFHFEDGDGVDPDNSEGDSDRDLEACGSSVFGPEDIQASNHDAEQDGGGSMDLGGGSSDHELVYDGGNYQWLGYRWNLDIPQGAVINSAYIEFEADEQDNETPVYLRIGAQNTDNAGVFTTSSNNIDDRWDGTIDSVTTAQVTWSPPPWSNNENGPDTTTPNLSTIVKEIVDRPGWSSGNGIVFIIKDDSGGTETNHRTAKHWDDDGEDKSANLVVNWGASSSTPDWQDNSGPHSSGSYYFDGVDDCFRSQNNVSGGDGNDIHDEDDSTSLWFKTDGPNIGEQMLVFWEGDGTYPLSDTYHIAIDVLGKIRFQYSTAQGSDTSTCTTTNAYDDSNWHHVVAVRGDGTDDCDLYIKDVNGNVEENVSVNYDYPGSSQVDADGKWYVGSAEGTTNFFKGWIDDVMHWNDDILTSSEADDLGRTNYGDNAHSFDVYLDKTDSNGVFIENLATELNAPTGFSDPKEGGDNDDWAYSFQNVTLSLPGTIIGEDERLDLYFTWKSPTATHEFLEVDMKIDDTDMNTPYSSYMQIPFPDVPFPTYYVHDRDDEFYATIANSGEDGIFLIYPGTRANFYSETEGSYAGLARQVNSTNITIDTDSLYIPPGAIVEVRFHEPTDIPSTNEQGNLITPGTYRTTIWVNGYSDQGETFSRSVPVGSIIVVS